MLKTLDVELAIFIHYLHQHYQYHKILYKRYLFTYFSFLKQSFYSISCDTIFRIFYRVLDVKIEFYDCMLIKEMKKNYLLNDFIGNIEKYYYTTHI